MKTVLSKTPTEMLSRNSSRDFEILFFIRNGMIIIIEISEIRITLPSAYSVDMYIL